VILLEAGSPSWMKKTPKRREPRRESSIRLSKIHAMHAADAPAASWNHGRALLI
jgi:hypothetical protein